MILGSRNSDIEAELGVGTCWHVMDSEIGICPEGEVEGAAVGDAWDDVGRFDEWG